MFLGSLLDGGVDFEALQEELSKLHIGGFRLERGRIVEKGIGATRLRAHCEEERTSRSLRDIAAIIEQSALSHLAKERSLHIFRRLAAAEAHIHSRAIEDIHFHEVGALDSIVDIVGSCIALELAAIDQVQASPIAAGMGTVECQHGILPLPAPATLELLKGIPIRSQAVDAELTTPTGAALLSSLSVGFGPAPPMKIESIGYGAGESDLPFPNLLRVRIGVAIKNDPSDPSDPNNPGNSSDPSNPSDLNSPEQRGDDSSNLSDEQELLTVMECNIDDMSPEWLSYIRERLSAAGALDVWVTAAYMKKGRPGHLLHLLTLPEKEEPLLHILFMESSSLGVRCYTVARKKLSRAFLKIGLPEGDVNVKVSYRHGKLVHTAPEYEDCRRLALGSGRPLKDIYEDALKAARALLAQKAAKR